MPRRPRIHIAGMPLHIVQRGHNRDACFFREDDYSAYRHWLGEALKESGCSLHAYVLMTNHVHLLLTPPQPQDVPRLIISVGRRYVQYINKTYRRTGTLWNSRYKSSLVQCVSVTSNSTRCAPPGWTIRRITVGAAIAQMHWDTLHPLYTDIAVDEALRQTNYRSLFRHVLDAGALSDIRLTLGQCQPLGNARFMDTIEQMTGSAAKPSRAAGQEGRKYKWL